MKLPCAPQNINSEFEKVALKLCGEPYSDIFAKKNNKTVAQTLEDERYAKLKEETAARYAKLLNRPLGEFLLQLKKADDTFYHRFLNKYGDRYFSDFRISDPAFLERKGVYAYFSGDELKYIGRCKDSMKKRINQGYGSIYPKNCYLDGQATNCRINALITKERECVSLWLCSLDSDEEIALREKQLISACDSPWNRRDA